MAFLLGHFPNFKVLFHETSINFPALPHRRQNTNLPLQRSIVVLSKTCASTKIFLYARGTCSTSARGFVCVSCLLLGQLFSYKTKLFVLTFSWNFENSKLSLRFYLLSYFIFNFPNGVYILFIRVSAAGLW